MIRGGLEFTCSMARDEYFAGGMTRYATAAAPAAASRPTAVAAGHRRRRALIRAIGSGCAPRIDGAGMTTAGTARRGEATTGRDAGSGLGASFGVMGR